MKAFVITTLIATAGVFFTVQSKSKTMTQPQAVTSASVAEAQPKVETLEGFVLEKPSFDSARQVWTVKLAVKKHKLYKNKALTISLPASDRKVKSYYMGDYVKLKFAVNTPTDSKDLSSEAVN